MSKEANSKGGNFSFDEAPWQREVVDAPDDPDVGRVVLMMASQTAGKTESINNMVGKAIDIDPCPMLDVQPTLEMGETWSTDRLATMLRDTPCLRGKVRDPRSRDSGNKILSKRFPGGHITIVGANSPAGLASRPIRKVFFDEVDRYPLSAGTEGDPIALAEKRTESFPDAVIVETSTPTIKGISRIEKSFERSDKRYWFVEFPCCGHQTNLRWEMVKWTDADAKTAWLECPNCRAKLADADRRLMILNGQWRATAPFKNGVRGYHLNGIYVLFAPKKPYKTRLEQMVAAFLEAKATGTEALKVWTNTFLAETWEETDLDSLVAHEIGKRAEDYGPEIPDGVLVLTAGGDVQRDRIEAFVMGHGVDRETWAVHYEILWGDPLLPQVWKDLDAFLERTYKTKDGIEMKVAAACIDSGDGKTVDSVYAFCKKRFGRRIYATKGANVAGLPIVGPLKRSKRGCPLFRIGTDTAKAETYGRLKIEEKGPGYAHFPKRPEAGFDQNFYVGLTCEKPRRVYKKGVQKIQWICPQGARNEPLDLFVLNLAAVGILQPAWAVLKRNLETKVKVYTVRRDEPAKADARYVKANEPKPDQPAKPKKRRLPTGTSLDWRNW